MKKPKPLRSLTLEEAEDTIQRRTVHIREEDGCILLWYPKKCEYELVFVGGSPLERIFNVTKFNNLEDAVEAYKYWKPPWGTESEAGNDHTDEEFKVLAEERWEALGTSLYRSFLVTS